MQRTPAAQLICTLAILMKHLLIIFMQLIICSCGETGGDQYQNSVVIPAGHIESDWVGHWLQDGELTLAIERNNDGNLILRIPNNETWKADINNIRWNRGKLSFHLYLYTEEMNGRHPYSGVRNECTIWMKDNIMMFHAKTDNYDGMSELARK